MWFSIFLIQLHCISNMSTNSTVLCRFIKILVKFMCLFSKKIDYSFKNITFKTKIMYIKLQAIALAVFYC